MRLTVLAFGIAKDIIGCTSVSLEWNGEGDVNALKSLLIEKYPELKALKSFRLAVNNHFAAPDEKIGEQDEVAIIPPVSGG